MREILFRGKLKENGRWVEGGFCYGNNNGESLICPQYDFSKEVTPKTVCQYSGEHDKRHKRIFEGDLLKDDNGFIYQVVFENGSFCFVAVSDFNIPYDTLPKDHNLDEFQGETADNVVAISALKWNHTEWGSYFEIIGNIYDNSELLGGNK